MNGGGGWGTYLGNNLTSHDLYSYTRFVFTCTYNGFSLISINTLNELIFIKHLEKFLAHSKYYKSATN